MNLGACSLQYDRCLNDGLLYVTISSFVHTLPYVTDHLVHGSVFNDKKGTVYWSKHLIIVRFYQQMKCLPTWSILFAAGKLGLVCTHGSFREIHVVFSFSSFSSFVRARARV